MRATLKNLSSFPRKTWCTVALPGIQNDDMDFVTDRGVRLRAERLRQLGTHSTIYGVNADFSGGESIQGEFKSRILPSTQFKYHSWVSDDIDAITPNFHVDQIGEIPWTAAIPIEMSNGCNVWELIGNKGGFEARAWLTIWDNDPVIDFTGTVIWSDRNDPTHDKTKTVILISKEPLVLDYSNNKYGVTFDGTSYHTLANCGFVDGSCVFFAGRMLCIPASGLPTGTGLRDLTAATDGPALGVCHNWEGKWLAHRNLPRPSNREPLQKTTNFDDHFAARPMGITQTPGRTGAQAGFGSSKGTEAVTFLNPEWIYEARWSVYADLFRGVCHFEKGDYLDTNNHPNWVTWSGYSDKRFGSDLLGKSEVFWGQRRASKWQGYDDQHRAQIDLAAYYALTGDHLAKFIIDHYASTDICNARYKVTRSMGAPRAVGRLAQTWADFHNLDFSLPWSSLLSDKIAIVDNQWLGKLYGPVQVLNYLDPDGRVQVHWNGELQKTWSVWEHALFCIGGYAAYKTTGDVRWLNIVKDVLRTIVLYGTFKEGNDWWLCDNVYWPESDDNVLNLAAGTPLPPEHYKTSSTLITPTRGGTGTWTITALRIAVELGIEESRTREILNQFWVGTADSYNKAEWWACAKI